LIHNRKQHVGWTHQDLLVIGAANAEGTGSDN